MNLKQLLLIITGLAVFSSGLYAEKLPPKPVMDNSGVTQQTGGNSGRNTGSGSGKNTGGSSQNDAYKSQCAQYWKNGKSYYDNGLYEYALDEFQQGLDSRCSNAGFADWVELCHAKLKQQAEANTTLGVSPTEIEFEASGGSKTLYVSTNASSWSYTNVYSWLSISKSGSQITLTCNANTGTSERTDNFYVKAGSKSVKVNIKQKGANPASNYSDLIAMNMNSNPTQSLNNGKYKGQKSNDGNRDGLGIYRWDEGSIYFGNWSNGNKDGYGIYIEQEGYNVINCPDCRYYVGSWVGSTERDMKSGKGTCYDKTGKLIYYGDFANNKPTETYPTTGGFSSYKFEVFTGNDDVYIGETKNGKRHGKGIYLWKDGGMWCGEWTDGERAGYGIHIFMDGSIKTGTWTGNTYSN